MNNTVTLVFNNCKLIAPKKLNWFNKLLFKLLGFKEVFNEEDM